MKYNESEGSGGKILWLGIAFPVLSVSQSIFVSPVF